jgi:hypothetical protein
MKPEYKERWIKALESGEYQQGVGALKMKDVTVQGKACTSFCCLGVLADLVKSEIPGARWGDTPIDEQGQFEFIGPTSTADCVLPRDVMALVGLIDDNPNVPHGGELVSLAALNDAGASFARIATLIKEHL